MTPVTKTRSATVSQGPPRQRRAHRYANALRRPQGAVGLALLLALVATGLLGGYLVGFGPLQQGPDSLAGPSAVHPLGTDEVGRDILARLIAGLRLDLFIVLVAVPVGGVLGTLLGLIGVMSELVSGGFQRVFDVLLGLPGVMMGITIAIVLNPGPAAVIITVIFATMPLFGRQARAALLTQRELDYVLAARALGASGRRVLGHHVLPNVLDAILVRIATSVAHAIKIEGGLSVIGLGIQLPQASLGSMIKGGASYLFDVPTYALAPVLTVVLIVIACTMLTDALNASVLRR